MQLFISWGGSTALQIAKSFNSNFLIFFSPTVVPFISPENIRTGEFSLNTIYENLDLADEGLVILTQSSYARQWVNFESGFIFSKKRELSVILVDNEKRIKNLGPLEAVQRMDWESKKGIIEYLSRFGMKREAIEIIVNQHFDNWINEVNSIIENEHPIDNNISKFYGLFNVDTSAIKENKIYSALINKFLNETDVTISEIESKFEIKAEDYPKFLLDLQRKLNVKTKSIALHNHFEKFWNTPIGGQIRYTASELSERIFVYNTEEDLEHDLSNLILHSKDYNIYLLSYDVLSTRYPDYAKDFSIISSGNHKAHAEYNILPLLDNLKTINFTINNHKTKKFEDSFDEIVSKSIPFDKEYDVEDLDEIKRLVFNYPKILENIKDSEDSDIPKLSKHVQKPIEMSDYIEIHDYEKHEEEHAYFIEMLEFMISKIDTSNSVRILELGAGTGILTKRLTNLNNVHVTAIEYDWACFKVLKHNLKKDIKNNKLELHHEDSRIYNPSGEFDIIVSSFSDHHIRPEDKFSYFKNVMRNLKPDGLFIVGDEFLKDYDPNNFEEYVEALKTYHNHIIDIAESKGQKVLASLERAALDSGINKKGDFKVSNSIYEKHLNEANFKHEKVLIGPKDIENIGGIYVYLMRK